MKDMIILPGMFILLLSCTAYAETYHIMWSGTNQEEGWGLLVFYYCYNYPCVINGTTFSEDTRAPLNSDETGVEYDRFFALLTYSPNYDLVTSSGEVVGDELCAGDAFKAVYGVPKGEWWSDGGDLDSPPINWVPDVEKFTLDLIKYHEAMIDPDEPWKEVYPTVPLDVSDGFVDKLTGFKVYQMGYLAIGDNLTDTDDVWQGAVVCSLKQTSSVTGADQRSGYYTVSGTGKIDYRNSLEMDCVYYLLGIGWEKGKYTLIQMPGIIYGYLDNPYRIEVTDHSRNISVVKPANPGLIVSSPGAGDLKIGEENTLRILLNNTGDVDVSIRRIYSNDRYRLISCDSEEIKPGMSVECLMSVTPEAGKRLDVSVDYKYKSCGRWVLANAMKSLIDYKDITLAASAQAYGFDVYGDCRNDYFGCDAPSREGTFVAGYRCFNKDGKYHVPSIGRFDLKYDLSTVPAGKEILGARLYLNAKTVNKAQTIIVYSTTNDKWQPSGCVPGGDICAQPWCKECLPLYDFAGKQESSVQVNGAGEYSLDVSDYLKESIGKGDKYASLQVMGREDEWSVEGEKTCNAVGQWTNQDVAFSGTGSSSPYLEVVYK